ncbi:MAG: LysM peptidoglycan-binding domain-containing protein, partial [Limnohabitans sp.]
MRVESNLPNATLGMANTTTVALSRPGFAQAMDKAMVQALPAHVKVIQAGDTLTSIVREQAQQQGVKLSPSEEFRWTQALAADSGIKNPNAIFPGQRLQMQNMLAQWQAGQTQPNNLAGAALPNPTNTADVAALANAANATNSATTNVPAATSTTTQVVNPKANSVSGLPKSNYINAVAHPVLSQTLDRAVSRGFIPKVEKQDVYNKVLQVANKHNFSPDDFARLTLMESDGMNPQASNTRCHGIIQFCDGPARGAAEVGFAKAPKQILGLSVYQQLHLVDTYFDKVKLKKEGPVPLDELYLAVLQPAARGEKRPEEPLGIPGKQAKYLYEGRDPQAPMTRVSITQGLMQNAIDRLGFNSFKHNQLGPQSNNTVGNGINQAMNP